MRPPEADLSLFSALTGQAIPIPPLRQIAENASEEGAIVLGKVLDAKEAPAMPGGHGGMGGDMY